LQNGGKIGGHILLLLELDSLELEVLEPELDELEMGVIIDGKSPSGTNNPAPFSVIDLTRKP
jgi:hypothetical protein